MTAKFTSAGQSDVRHHLHPYTQLRDHERDGPLVIVRGEGVQVFDEHGKAYIEGMAGLWCASLGFSEQRLADAAFRQMSTLPYYHSFSGKVPGPVTHLVEAMIKWATVPMARVKCPAVAPLRVSAGVLCGATDLAALAGGARGRSAARC